MKRRYRVIQWATGNIGSHAMRAVIQHPAMELVGLYVYSDKKAGQDAGEMVGLKPIGVKATRSVDEICALEADCVLYMPQYVNYDDVCKLLASGKNVVSTRGEFHLPSRMDPVIRSRVEEACRTGKSSIHSTGSSPGFATEALPLVLTSLSRRLDHLRVEEFADLSSRNSPDLLFNVMGFGKTDLKADQRRALHMREAFGGSLEVTAQALGLSFDSIEAFGELGAARRDIQIAAGTIGKGTVAAQRNTVTCMKDGKAIMSFCATWYCTKEVDADWDLGDTGWRVRVDGDTPLKVDITFPVAPEKWAQTSPGLTAHRAVNAVAVTCEADPGIRTTAELPQFIADLSRH